MNIFVLDKDPKVAARMLFDKHVVKMALETAQMLSTINGGPYKPTHVNHPCTKWARSNMENYNWLVEHGLEICKEYTYRYSKEHKCEDIIMCLKVPLEGVVDNSAEPLNFVQCMVDDFKQEDPILAYRDYYKFKASFANWTKRSPPEWWNEGVL